jgi:rhamnogalacturonyl hydrolase YesR
MRRTLSAALAIAFLLSSVPAFARRRAVTPRGPSTSPYLTEAIAAAEWLTSLERTAGANALSWPAVEGGTSVVTGIDNGAAGIGAYFLKLYESTRDPRWLDKAERAARFVMSEHRAGRYSAHDWLAGSSGAGEFLLAVYAASQKQEFLDGAKGAGDYLLRVAIVDGDGVYWKHAPTFERTYTGLAHGAAGVGIFLVRLYEATNDTRYLDYAKRAYHWLKAYQVNLPGKAAIALGWKRLTTDSDGYTGWCGGAAGIVTFVDELHRVTGKAEYLDAWRATIEGLYVSATHPRDDEAAWWRYTRNEGPSLAVIYCHGTAANATIVANAAARTGDARYIDLTADAARWLDRIAIETSEGLLWQHFSHGDLRERGLQTGTASVGTRIAAHVRRDRRRRTSATRDQSRAVPARRRRSSAAGPSALARPHRQQRAARIPHRLVHRRRGRRHLSRRTARHAARPQTLKSFRAAQSVTHARAASPQANGSS